MRRLLALLLVFGLALPLAACGNAAPYAAIVNGKPIPKSEIDDELNAILSNKEYRESLEQGQPIRGAGGDGTFDMAFVSRVLTRQIFLELVHQEFVRRKLELSKADLASAERDVQQSFVDPADPTGKASFFQKFPKSYRDGLVRRTAEVAVLQLALTKVDASDAAVKRYYEENATQFRQTCVSHILVDTDAEAGAAKARLDKGEPFAAVAGSVSKDPGSAASGGDLGCVAPGSFVPEFEAAMDTLADNVVSAPVQTQFGWHLIRVTGHKAQDLAEVKDAIRQRLLQPSQESFNDFLRDTLATAKIDVNPRYGHFDKDGQQPGVVAPNAPKAKRGNDQIPSLPQPGGEGQEEGGEPGAAADE